MAILKDPAKTWQDFMSSFGVTAYDENTVPEDATFPRLTYEYAVSNFDSPVTISASLWYYSRKWKEITEKSEEIYDVIGDSGKLLPIEGGYLWVKRGDPFAQRMRDENDNVRRIYINFTVEYLRR